MFLVEKSSSHLFSLHFSSSSSSKKPNPTSSPFDDALAARLRTLLPIPDTGISLYWLSLAVRVLSVTLSDASALLLTPSDHPAAHLDWSLALLDASNAAAAEIDRLLRHHSLLLRFALHLLSSAGDDGGAKPSPDRLRRAREAIAEWQSAPRRAIRPDAAALVLSLAPAEPPRRNDKHSAAHRAIYALEAVSSLVAGAVVSVLGGGELVEVRVPGEFPWASEYEMVLAAVSGQLRSGLAAAEVEAVEAAVKRLTDVINDSNGDGQKTERLRKAVEETEEVTAKLTGALERLSNDVNGLFRAALSERNTILQKFRVGSEKCNW